MASPNPEVPTAQVPEPNPLFQELPSRVWECFRDPLKMAASTQSVLAWVKQEEIAQGARENNGVAKVYTEIIDGVPHELPVMPNGGFFKLIMRVEGKDDVPLLFSFRDLYLVGFLHGNIWWVFDDANLDGSGHLKHMEAWKPLNFDGGYDDGRMEKVPIGIEEVFMTHDTLSNYAQRRVHQRDEVQNALFRIMVLIPEAVRFPVWRSHLLGFLRDWGSNTVDGMGVVPFLFNDWAAVSKRVMAGKDKFKPDMHFSTYAELVRHISILLPERD